MTYERFIFGTGGDGMIYYRRCRDAGCSYICYGDDATGLGRAEMQCCDTESEMNAIADRMSNDGFNVRIKHRTIN